MTTLTIQPDKTAGRFFLSGEMNETLDLTPLMNTPARVLILNFKDMEFINSMGVKKWVNGIRALQAQGKTLEYEECSETFMGMCNMVPAFTQGVTVRSFEVVAQCPQCRKYLFKLLKTQELDRNALPFEMTCTGCGTTALLDESTFAFMEDLDA